MEYNKIESICKNIAQKPVLKKHDTLIFIEGFSHKILSLTEKAVLLQSNTKGEYKNDKVWIPLSQIKILFSSLKYASYDGKNWFSTTMFDYICSPLDEKFKIKLKP